MLNELTFYLQKYYHQKISGEKEKQAKISHKCYEKTTAEQTATATASSSLTPKRSSGTPKKKQQLTRHPPKGKTTIREELQESHHHRLLRECKVDLQALLTKNH